MRLPFLKTTVLLTSLLSFNLFAQKKPSGSSKDSTSISFDEIDITGARRSPLGSLVNKGNVNKSYDFIPLRKTWKKKILKSVESIETIQSTSTEKTKNH